MGVYIWCVCALSHTYGWAMDKQVWKPLAVKASEEVEEERQPGHWKDFIVNPEITKTLQG